LPTASDDENLPITCVTFQKYKSALPSFMTFDSASSTYTMSPVEADKPGKYPIQVDLSDSMGASKSYSFDVSVLAKASTDSVS
jgi:hypothetical protein